MDQQKVGSFLKELRCEKGLTQAQVAEEFHTTNRSVSRWENGKTMPDISILVELADYADEQGSRLLVWVRRISLIGVVVMAVVLALQTFGYEPDIVSFLCYGFSILGFVVMVIQALYANGKLEKIVAHKNFFNGCIVLVSVACVAVLSFLMKIFLLVVMVAITESTPTVKLSGIENYNKGVMLENYGGDIDSGLFLFPDDTESMMEPTYESGMKTGLFDTECYIILQTQYSQEDYQAEIERLSDIECTLSHNNKQVTQKVKYDEESYALPAYVAVDGFSYVYEYALVNDKRWEITYILLSYPNSADNNPYQEYLKLDATEYEIEESWNQFSIYAHSFDGGNSWMEYSDLQ